MPRTTTVEVPGCLPIRALTFDTLGFIKVVESQGEQNHPHVVERWGNPDSSNSIFAASIIDDANNPLLSVARKCCKVEVLNPLNGKELASVDIRDESGNSGDPAGLHLFRRYKSSGSCKLLTCNTKGDARLVSVKFDASVGDDPSAEDSNLWKVCGSGNIEVCQVDAGEGHALFGGKGIEVNLWDIEKFVKTWTAKPPPKNSLGIFTPTWFTSASFLSDGDPRKFAAGTNKHQVRLYDTSAQRRPVMSFDFRESPIKAISSEQDEHTIYIGTGSGDLASVDIRTGKLLGCFIGKCCGSIRSLARHPDLPLLASCGLDSYLRLWDVKTRQPVSAIFLKQPLTKVLFDSNFAPIVEIKPEENHTEEMDSQIIKDKCKKRSSTTMTESQMKIKSHRKLIET